MVTTQSNDVPGAPQVRRRSTADIVFTPILSVVLPLVALGIWFGAGPTFNRAVPNCDYADAPCDLYLKLSGGSVACDGVLLGLVIGIVGLVVARHRGTVMAIWPALGLVVMIATYFVGLAMAFGAGIGYGH